MLTSAKTTDAIKHIIIAVVAVFTALEKAALITHNSMFNYLSGL